MTNTTAAVDNKIVTIKILDHSGDTTLLEETDEAIRTITEQHFSYGRWPFVGTRYFQFTAKSLNDLTGIRQDAIALKSILDASPRPTVVLSGELLGGIFAD